MNSADSTIHFKSRVFLQKLCLFTCSLARIFCKSSVVETTCGLQNYGRFKIDGLNFAIYFKSRVFCKNSVYLRVCLHERFVNPQLLKQLAVYKIREE